MGSRIDGLLRRGMDVAGSLTALVALAPVLVIIAVLIKLTSPGPAFFVQERVGRNSVRFRLLKFRTMAAGSGRANGVTVGDDPRITRLGAVLRHYKLDELPQLVNVLRGDMSLVGPRPEVPSYVERYTPAQRRVLSVRPGLTDPASLAFHDEAGLLATYPDPVWTYRETVLPRKIGLSLEYLSRRTIATDVAVLARTALLLLSSRRRAASPPPVQGDGASGP